MAFLAYLKEPRDFLYKERNPDQALASLESHLKQPGSPEEKRAVYELLGLILRSQKRYEEAYKAYQQIDDHYQAGYCCMLMGQLQRVQQHWTQVWAERNNHWCVALFGMITHNLRVYPTLFQIRNHIESDIANLIAADQTVYLENLLSYVDLLTSLNLETPKFAGRALMHAGWLDRSGPFLLKGQKALPNDPEIYFHLGQYGVHHQRWREARLMLNQCLLISPSYTPAKELLTLIADKESPA